MTRSSVFPATSYSQPKDSLNQDVVSIVEKSMKKHTDNIMRFLEGISSRLSQLELCCYNLDKSIGEMRSDSVRDNEEADSKLKSLEKHIQEVHRSVQILRDKQELAETQKELYKLQLAQKEPSSSSHSQSSEEKAAPAASDPKTTDNASEIRNQQLALALPHQGGTSTVTSKPDTTRPTISSVSATVAPAVTFATTTTSTALHAAPDQASIQYSVPQPLSSRADTMPYGYGSGRAAVPQQPPPQQIKGNFGAQPSDVYATAGPHPGLPPGSAYMIYDGETGRTHHPSQQPHFPQGVYPPQPAAGAGMPPRHSSSSHFVRNNPYTDLIEKLVNMGFRGDHVVNVIQRMEEGGEPVDFNAVLDRLSAHSSGGSQRGGWSG
ncbi:hypothetical protein OIU77_004829 [Salix suchowensis]|uniref:DUF1421 domain-containing protein n=1 Tax=Salix suchowensis TaxID=1278906 RepID=A0ABQ9AYL0_9ROSI|nr:hypothetical protein OIU77_004829 [Salix suchowensis]